MIQIEDKNNGILNISNIEKYINNNVTETYYYNVINDMYNRVDDIQLIIKHFIKKEDLNRFSESVNNSLNEILNIIK